MSEVIGYAIISGSNYNGALRVEWWKVCAVTAIAKKMVYYREGRLPRNASIEEIVLFRDTKEEADAALAEILASLAGLIATHNAADKAARAASAELHAAARKLYEPKPAPKNSKKPPKLANVSTADLEAALKARQQGQS